MEDDGAFNEDAYDVSTVRGHQRPTPSVATVQVGTLASAPPEAPEPPPEWAKQWHAQGKTQPKTDARRLTGNCVSWHADRGYGFIQRDDGLADIYVHQRDIQRAGFRSLRERELVEFDVGKMEDGKLFAKNVTGPNGADCIGLPHGSSGKRARGDDDESDDGGDGPTRTTKPAHGASAEASKSKSSKPGAAMAFVPRAVVRKKK